MLSVSQTALNILFRITSTNPQVSRQVAIFFYQPQFLSFNSLAFFASSHSSQFITLCRSHLWLIGSRRLMFLTANHVWLLLPRPPHTTFLKWKSTVGINYRINHHLGRLNCVLPKKNPDKISFVTLIPVPISIRPHWLADCCLRYISRSSSCDPRGHERHFLKHFQPHKFPERQTTTIKLIPRSPAACPPSVVQAQGCRLDPDGYSGAAKNISWFFCAYPLERLLISSWNHDDVDGQLAKIYRDWMRESTRARAQAQPAERGHYCLRVSIWISAMVRWWCSIFRLKKWIVPFCVQPVINNYILIIRA